jgi:hypothetical protein
MVKEQATETREAPMKITVEVNPEDLSAITDQVMKTAGPEAVSKIWMMIGQQIAGQMQAQMLSQVPEAFRPFFSLYGDSPPSSATGRKS